MKKSPKSFVLVLTQFACIIYLAKNSYWHQSATMFFGLGFIILGIGLGVWSISTFNIWQLTVMPEPKDGGELIQVGPYKYIRHPMYSAVLMFSLGLLSSHIHFISVLVYFILVATLLIKIEHEEHLLKQSFPGYTFYATRSKKLIPGLY